MNDERYPDGKLNPSDEGALSMAIGTEKGRVHIEFPKLVKWIALPPDMAIDVAEILIKHARECGSKKPLNILFDQPVSIVLPDD